MLRQRFPRRVDSVDDSFGKFSLPKKISHDIGNAFPKWLATPGVHRRVPQYREVLRFRRNENQDGIPMLGFVHAQFHELVRACVTRVADFAMADIHANFARRVFFRLLDDSGDSFVVQFGK